MTGKSSFTDNYDKLEALYRAEYGNLLRFANSILHNTQYAEDAVQDTFVVAHRKIDKCLGCPNPVQWLYNALRITIKEVLRDQAKTRNRWVTLDNLPELSIEMDSDNILKDSQDADLILLQRVYVEGYTAEEMAKEYGTKLSAMKMRISRAKRKFRDDPEKFSKFFGF